MDKASYSGKIFTYFEYAKECDFEKDAIEHAKEVFGPKSETKINGVRSSHLT